FVGRVDALVGGHRARREILKDPGATADVCLVILEQTLAEDRRAKRILPSDGVEAEQRSGAVRRAARRTAAGGSADVTPIGGDAAIGVLGDVLAAGGLEVVRGAAAAPLLGDECDHPLCP